jgi:dipeptidyl aminopeptidase/acylaminoacyl peptidase
MSSDGSNVTAMPPAAGNDYQPDWSPDGTRIAVTNEQEHYDIYVMNADGTGRTRLTTHPDADSEPAWSPEGTQIAFTSDRDGNPEIYLMNADGGSQMRLTNDPGIDTGAAWQPILPLVLCAKSFATLVVISIIPDITIELIDQVLQFTNSTVSSLARAVGPVSYRDSRVHEASHPAVSLLC